MKLSPILLMDRLQEAYTITACPAPSTTDYLDGAYLYEKDSPILDNYAYLVDPSVTELDTWNLPESCFLIFCASNKHLLSSHVKQYCIIENPDSTSRLINTINGIFYQYQNWENQMLNASLRKNSLQYLLNISYPVLKAPLVLISMDFSVLAKIGTDSLPGGYFSLESDNPITYINALKQDTLYNQMREFEEPFVFPDRITGDSALALNIKRFGTTTHRLLLLKKEEDILQSDYLLIRTLAERLDYALSHNAMTKTSKDNFLHTVLLTAISDRTADYVKISQQLASGGWLDTHDYLCVVIKVTYLDQVNLTLNAICNYIENMIAHSCAFQYKDDIVIFINLTKSEQTPENISSKLIYFVRDSFLKTGYSRTMPGHANLRRQYLQACIALDVGIRKSPFLWVHYFNDNVLEFILEETTKKLPGYMICHEKLLALQEMDRSQNTEYLLTLRTYLENHHNAVQSAKDLFIHRSTFLYRLDKIKQILDTDLDDIDDILYLLLSFRLLDQEEQTGRQTL